MKLAVAFFAAVAIVVLASCGGSSAQDDPYVGTWRPVGGTHAPGGLVISKGRSGYAASFVTNLGTSGPMLLQRHGQQFVLLAQNGLRRQTFTYHPDTGRLTDSMGGFQLERVSDGTSHPTPQPQNASPNQTFTGILGIELIGHGGFQTASPTPVALPAGFGYSSEEASYGGLVAYVTTARGPHAGKTVVQVRPGHNGLFRVALKPGWYHVFVKQGSVWPGATRSVHVGAGETTRVMVHVQVY